MQLTTFGRVAAVAEWEEGAVQLSKKPAVAAAEVAEVKQCNTGVKGYALHTRQRLHTKGHIYNNNHVTAAGATAAGTR